MAMLDDIKVVLRVTNTAFDSEITDRIAEAREDLILSGIKSAKANSDTDVLIKRAITTYVKAQCGYENPDYERLLASYTQLKLHLTLAGDYT